MSIIVSPLIRVHNETRFSIELRFRRPQQKEDEFALVVLKPGETIDDSVAMFDSLHLSGGLKKALTSLSLGKHFELLLLWVDLKPFEDCSYILRKVIINIIKQFQL